MRVASRIDCSSQSTSPAVLAPNFHSTHAVMKFSVACPLGSDPCPGVWIIGWTCGENSNGRLHASACLNRISASTAKRSAVSMSSSVQRLRDGCSPITLPQ